MAVAIDQGLEPAVLSTVSSADDFAALAGEWDGLVRAMPRPTPYLLHGWLREWWREHGEDAELAVHVARRGGRLAAALPLFVRRRPGARVLHLLGGYRSLLADVLVAEDEGDSLAAGLAELALELDFDYADLYGLPAGSRLEAAVGPERLELIERAESPVLDLERDWEAVLRRKLSHDGRHKLRRKRRALEAQGAVEVVWASAGEELERAVEETFRLHALRWRGRPDVSGITASPTRRFLAAAYRAVAAGAPGTFRIALLRLDGRAIAFHAHFALANRLFAHRLGFDPELGRFSPGSLLMVEVLERACRDGLERVELLGPAEPYKEPFTDRYEPMYEALGLARGVRGRALVAAHLGGIHVRRALRRRKRLRAAYVGARAALRRFS